MFHSLQRLLCNCVNIQIGFESFESLQNDMLRLNNFLYVKYSAMFHSIKQTIYNVSFSSQNSSNYLFRYSNDPQTSMNTRNLQSSIPVTR